MLSSGGCNGRRNGMSACCQGDDDVGRTGRRWTTRRHERCNGRHNGMTRRPDLLPPRRACCCVHVGNPKRPRHMGRRPVCAGDARLRRGGGVTGAASGRLSPTARRCQLASQSDSQPASRPSRRSGSHISRLQRGGRGRAAASTTRPRADSTEGGGGCETAAWFRRGRRRKGGRKWRARSQESWPCTGSARRRSRPALAWASRSRGGR